ncbi:MAG: hypothetical protein JWN85_1191 [Gammaproteobacteria bacterium]|nr:hypothetical protein [Gammaproteobacteria bacterium]
MRFFRVILVSGLLTGVAAHAQAAPDWSAYIGTGQAVDGGNFAAGSDSPLEPAATAPLPWSALFGTGEAAAKEEESLGVQPALDSAGSPASSAPAMQATLNWSEQIGSGAAAAAE